MKYLASNLWDPNTKLVFYYIFFLYICFYTCNISTQLFYLSALKILGTLTVQTRPAHQIRTPGNTNNLTPLKFVILQTLYKPLTCTTFRLATFVKSKLGGTHLTHVVWIGATVGQTDVMIRNVTVFTTCKSIRKNLLDSLILNHKNHGQLEYQYDTICMLKSCSRRMQQFAW